MGVITGKDADAKSNGTSLWEVTDWKFSTEVNIVEYASNKTAGIKKKLAGSKSADGEINGVFNDDNPIYGQIEEEDVINNLGLYWSATLGVTMKAIITGMEFECNIDDGEIETWSAKFGAQGAWTYPGASLLSGPGGGGPSGLRRAGVRPLGIDPQVAEGLGLRQPERTVMQMMTEQLRQLNPDNFHEVCKIVGDIKKTMAKKPKSKWPTIHIPTREEAEKFMDERHVA